MNRVYFVVMLVVRLLFVFLIPGAVFWSIATLIPSWGVPYNTLTIVAFWILYGAVRYGVQTIRQSNWDTSMFMDE